VNPLRPKFSLAGTSKPDSGEADVMRNLTSGMNRLVEQVNQLRTAMVRWPLDERDMAMKLGIRCLANCVDPWRKLAFEHADGNGIGDQARIIHQALVDICRGTAQLDFKRAELNGFRKAVDNAELDFRWFLLDRGISLAANLFVRPELGRDLSPRSVDKPPVLTDSKLSEVISALNSVGIKVTKTSPVNEIRASLERLRIDQESIVNANSKVLELQEQLRILRHDAAEDNRKKREEIEKDRSRLLVENHELRARFETISKDLHDLASREEENLAVIDSLKRTVKSLEKSLAEARQVDNELISDRRNAKSRIKELLERVALLESKDKDSEVQLHSRQEEVNKLKESLGSSFEIEVCLTAEVSRLSRALLDRDALLTELNQQLGEIRSQSLDQSFDDLSESMEEVSNSPREETDPSGTLPESTESSGEELDYSTVSGTTADLFDDEPHPSLPRRAKRI